MAFEVMHHDAEEAPECWGTFDTEEDARRFISGRVEPEEDFELVEVNAQ